MWIMYEKNSGLEKIKKLLYIYLYEYRHYIKS